MKPSPKDTVSRLDRGLCVNAGAGSGKTAMLVHRYVEILRQGKSDPSRVVAITFTEKAAAEMKSRVRDAVQDRATLDRLAEARISTIHGFCASLLRQYPVEADIDPRFSVMDSVQTSLLLKKTVRAHARRLLEKRDARVLQCLETLKPADFSYAMVTLLHRRAFLRVHGEAMEKLRREDLSKEMAAAEWSADDAKMLACGTMLLQLAREFDAEFAEAKAAQSRLDFEDLQILALDLLSKPRMAEKICGDIDYLLVDEFQDTDELQRRLFERLAPMQKIFAVGDPKQSIYRFRGSDVSVFDRVQKDMQGHGDTLLLDVNYRSLPGIVEFCNAFFSALMPPSALSYETPHQTLIAHREAKAAPRVMACVHAAGAEKESADDLRARDAAHVARMLRQWKDGAPPWPDFQWRDAALLFRSMGKAYLYERELEKLGIPYVSTASGAFYGQQCVGDVLHAMKAALNPADDFAMTGFLRSPLAAVSDETLYRLRMSQPPSLWKAMQESDHPSIVRAVHWLRRWHSIACMQPPITLLRQITEDTDAEAILLTQHLGRKKAHLLARMAECAAAFAPEEGFTLSDFLEYMQELVLEDRGDSDGALPEEDAVSLLTVHKSKGLEFRAVFVVDLARSPKSDLPKILLHERLGVGIKAEEIKTLQRQAIEQEEKRRQEAEEKRILYVACTRARDLLIFSGVMPAAKRPNLWNQWLRGQILAPGMEKHVSCETINPPTSSRGSRRPAGASVAGNPVASSPPFTPQAWDFAMADFSQQAQPKTRFLATEIQEMFSESKPLARPPLPILDNASTPAQLGSMAHEVLAHWDMRNAKECDALLQHVAGAGAQKDAQEELKDMLMRFAASADSRRLIEARAKHREIPFVLPLPGAGSAFLEGTIDLLYQDAQGDWAVLDYKTDRVPADQCAQQAQRHIVQLRLYGAAAMRILGLPSIRLELYFLRSGTPWSETFTAAQAASFLQQVMNRIKIPVKTPV